MNWMLCRLCMMSALAQVTIHYLQQFKFEVSMHLHTTYTRNNMRQKCEGNCGLWVLNEMIKKTYPEKLKKIVGAIWELPAK